MPKSLFGYVRTSRSDQRPENQIKVLQDQGVPPGNIFIDEGVSGNDEYTERPGYMRLRRALALEPGETVLYVFEISRIGRNFVQTLQEVLDLEKEGVQVWSLSQDETWMRTEDPGLRQLILAILAWTAQREREDLIKRVRLGLERARSEGRTIGRPRKEIPWSQVDKFLAKKISLAGVSRILDIPYSTLFRNFREREAAAKQRREAAAADQDLVQDQAVQDLQAPGPVQDPAPHPGPGCPLG